MRRIVIALLLLFTQPLLAQEFVEVTGRGYLQQAPDFVQITLGVEGQNKNAALAARENAQMMATLVSFLQQTGVAKKDMSSQRLHLDTLVDYQNNRITGYRASRSILVKVRDIEGFDQLLVDLADLGGNRMQSLNFGLDEPSLHQTQLLQLAMDDAKNKASILAQLGARQLGQALHISENSNTRSSQVPVLMARALNEAAAPVPPSLQTPKVALHYQVNVRYQLK